MTNTQKLGEVIRYLIAYRGWASPEALDQSYRPNAAPVGGATIRRIMNGEDQHPDEKLKLVRLAPMLRLPPTALKLVYEGDTAGIESLIFPGEDGDSVRQFILNLMRDDPKPARRRAAR